MNQLNYYRKKFTILTFLIICLSTALFLTGCGKSQEKPAPTSEKETTLTGLDTQDETEPDTEEKSTDSPIPAESKITPAVFRATDADGHEIYLMGSIHLADADAAVYPDYFEKIYQWSDALAVECDTTNSLSSALSMSKKLIYMDGTTVRDHVPKDVYEKVVSVLKQEGVFSSSYERIKAWMWPSLIELSVASELGLSGEYGIDNFLINRYKNDQKEILEIESVDFQMDLLTNLPEETEKILFSSLANDNIVEEYRNQLKNLYEKWKAGTLEADDLIDQDSSEVLDSFTKEERQAYEEYNRMLLYDRNEHMAKTILDYLKGNKKILVVVGASHFYGDQGILQLLKDQGLTIENVHMKE